MEKDEALAKLAELLTADELSDLFDAAMIITAAGSGFGQIILAFRNSRIERVECSVSKVPRLRRNRNKQLQLP